MMHLKEKNVQKKIEKRKYIMLKLINTIGPEIINKTILIS